MHLTHIYTAVKSMGFKLMTALFIFIAPIKLTMILIGMSIFFDTGFGIWASMKTGQKITSSRFSAVISKMLIYQLTIITFYGIDIAILGDFAKLIIGIPLVITKLAAIVLISVETYSIDEKLKMVNPEKGLWFYCKRILGIAKLIKKEKKELEK